MFDGRESTVTTGHTPNTQATPFPQTSQEAHTSVSTITTVSPSGPSSSRGSYTLLATCSYYGSANCVPVPSSRYHGWINLQWQCGCEVWLWKPLEADAPARYQGIGFVMPSKFGQPRPYLKVRNLTFTVISVYLGANLVAADICISAGVNLIVMG